MTAWRGPWWRSWQACSAIPRGLHYVLVGACSGLRSFRLEAADMASVVTMRFPEIKQLRAQAGTSSFAAPATLAPTETIPPTCADPHRPVSPASRSLRCSRLLLPGVVLRAPFCAGSGGATCDDLGPCQHGERRADRKTFIMRPARHRPSFGSATPWSSASPPHRGVPLGIVSCFASAPDLPPGFRGVATADADSDRDGGAVGAILLIIAPPPANGLGIDAIRFSPRWRGP